MREKNKVLKQQIQAVEDKNRKLEQTFKKEKEQYAEKIQNMEKKLKVSSFLHSIVFKDTVVISKWPYLRIIDFSGIAWVVLKCVGAFSKFYGICFMARVSLRIFILFIILFLIISH